MSTHCPATKENDLRSILVPKPSLLQMTSLFEQKFPGKGM